MFISIGLIMRSSLCPELFFSFILFLSVSECSYASNWYLLSLVKLPVLETSGYFDSMRLHLESQESLNFADCSSAMTLYNQLPVAKSVVLHRLSSWGVSTQHLRPSARCCLVLGFKCCKPHRSSSSTLCSYVVPEFWTWSSISALEGNPSIGHCTSVGSSHWRLSLSAFVME